MSTPGAKDRKSQSLTIAVSLRMRGKGEIQTQFQYFLLFIPSFWLAESQRRQERKAATVLALEAKLEPERTLSKSLPFLQYSSKKEEKNGPILLSSSGSQEDGVAASLD